MLSLKETKPITEMETDSITISSPATIDVDSIVNAGSSAETISIVIPLSAQLSTLSGRLTLPLSIKERDEETTEAVGQLPQLSFETNPSRREDATRDETIESVSLSITQGLAQGIQTIKGKELASWLSGKRADKTKGCPFPSCSRYGRAFSRAHDLKRHIARHETRKERLVETSTDNGDNCTCSQCGESFANETILQRHARLHANSLDNVELQSSASLESPRIYSCGICKKKYTNERKFKAHLVSHAKNSEGNACPLCDSRFDGEEMLQNHMRDNHASSSIAEPHQDFEKVTDKSTQAKDDDDDDFMLEEMLLLNKNPRINGTNEKNHNAGAAATSSSVSSSTGSPSNGSKIRCDYCSKTFKTKWTLSSHVAAHEGRFQFGCTRCGKKFVRKSHFEGHVRSHEAARPYVCEQCGKTFKELKHRREHTKRKHPGNRNAIQNLLDSISACVSEESAVEQAKFTLLMPINFGP